MIVCFVKLLMVVFHLIPYMKMIDGKIVKTGPFEFAKEIESNGYLRENEMSDNDARE